MRQVVELQYKKKPDLRKPLKKKTSNQQPQSIHQEQQMAEENTQSEQKNNARNIYMYMVISTETNKDVER